MNGGAGRCNPDVTNAKQRNYLLTDTVINALYRAQFDVGDVLAKGQNRRAAGGNDLH
jgi:hypothetical protein